MTLLERFANPDIIKAMPFGEKMLASGYVAILGMGITFLALIILWGTISVMSRTIAGIENRKTVVKVAPQAPAPATATVEPEETAFDDMELVAVITAAIAAATDRPASRIVVRDIRRAGGEQPAWRQAGIQRQVSKRM